MAIVGDDADPYLRRLDDLKLPRTHVHLIDGSFATQAFVATDLDDQEITAFRYGAMSYSHFHTAVRLNEELNR